MKSHVYACILAFAAASSALAANDIEAGLIGTWKLEGVPATVYWSVREDGVYRVMGAGANPRHAGTLKAAAGRWSLNSPIWVDQGTYQLRADTWTVTSRLGTSNWKRVWKPVAGASNAEGPGLCALLAASEVARALSAPVIAGPMPGGGTGCLYKSTLNSGDEVRVTGVASRRQAWATTRRTPTPAIVTIPGVGEDAYADGLDSGTLTAHILNGATQFQIRMTLLPVITPGSLDLPALTTLARAAAPRLASPAAQAVR